MLPCFHGDDSGHRRRRNHFVQSTKRPLWTCGTEQAHGQVMAKSCSQYTLESASLRPATSASSSASFVRRASQCPEVMRSSRCACQQPWPLPTTRSPAWGRPGRRSPRSSPAWPAWQPSRPCSSNVVAICASDSGGGGPETAQGAIIHRHTYM